MLATINWSGAGDNTTWNLASNWVGGQVPGSNDDAVINVPSNPNIVLPNRSTSVHSLSLAAGDSLTLDAGSLMVQGGGLTLNGTLNLGKTDGSTAGQLYFQGTQSLSGTGTVMFGGSTGNALYGQGNGSANPATLTIGAGINIQGGSGSIRGYYITSSSDSIINNSTFSFASGGTMTIGGINWVNNGSITAGGTVNLVGSFTPAALGTFNATGATVNLQGTLNNAGTTLALSPTLGNWHLQNGSIVGGTVTSSGGAKLALTNSGGTLSGVTIDASLTVDATQQSSGNTTNVTNGLTLNGTLNLGKTDGSTAGQLYFQGTQSLSGTGTVMFGGSTGNALYGQGNGSANPATLTIGAGINIQGGSGSIRGYYITSSSDSIINNSTFSFASGGTMTIGGINWVNNGSITAGGTVNLVGSFTPAALGTFNATGATVNLQGTLNNAGTTLALSPTLGNWHLQNGSIVGGTVTSSGGAKLALTNSGGTLSGVTIDASLTVDATQQSSGNTTNVTNGLTLNGTLNLGKTDGSTAGQLYFQGTQSLSGTGTVMFGGSTGNALYGQGNGSANPATLTIGAGINIQGGSGSIRGYYITSSSDSIINNSTFSFASGGTMTIGGINWVNNGSITAGGTVNLVGSFTPAALGTFNATGATVNLQGTLNNAGTTLALSPTLGNWHLQNGSIVGGTVTSSGGAKLALTNSGGTLSGVTIDASLTVDATQQSSGNTTNVTNGLTLNGTLNLGKTDGSTAGQLYFQGTQSLSGTGTVMFGGSTGNALYGQGNGSANPATLTIGAGINIQGGSGSIRGYYITSSSDSIINNSTFSFASGGTMTIGGINWVNNGSITAGGTVNLVGSFTPAALGTFNATGATVNLQGTLNNAGTTLALSPTLGNWHLQNGSIVGGTVTSSGGAKLALTNSGGTLSGVTIDASLTVDATQQSSGNTTNVTNGLTLNGTLNLGKTDGSTAGQLYFQGTQSLSGTGTVMFGGSTGNALYGQGNGSANPATLTIGAGINIQGGSGSIRGYYITSSSDSIINNSTFSFASGGTMTIGGINWVNNGSITAGGTVNLVGSFTPAALGTFNATGATVNLQGTLNNAGTTLALSPTLGNWHLQNGSIVGGTVTSSGGAKLALTNSGGTLSGVTIDASLTVDATQQSSGNTTNVTNGLTLNGTLNLGKTDGSTAGQLYFQGTQSLSGTGTVMFGGSTGNALYGQGNGSANPATLTIGAGINIQGGSGSIRGYYITSSSDSVVVLGKVAAGTAGATISVGNGGSSKTLASFIAIGANNGGTVQVSESLQIDSSAIVSVTSNSSLLVGGNLLGNTQSVAAFNPQGSVTLNGTGTAATPNVLEVMGADVGTTPAGFTDNFVFGSLALAANNYVRLVDQSDNSTGVGPEAIYTNSLIVPTGSTLDLNGLHLYTRAAQIGGTILNGTVTQIPDSGASRWAHRRPAPSCHQATQMIGLSSSAAAMQSQSL